MQALSQETAMWKRTSREKYWYALEVLPPAYQDANGFLLGEPQDHRECEITHVTLPHYDAYVEKRGRFYVSIRPLTLAECKKYVPRMMRR
jgi:hypothetical protein